MRINSELSVSLSRSQLSLGKGRGQVLYLKELIRFSFFSLKPACTFPASDTPPRASTGTARRGWSGNTWRPEASPPSCQSFTFSPCCWMHVHRELFYQPSLSNCLHHSSFLPLLASTSRYYHSRAPPRPSASAASTQSSADVLQDDKKAAKAPIAGTTPLPGFMGGVRVFFYNLPASERKRLARYLITYPLGSQWQSVGKQTHVEITTAWMSQSEAAGLQMTSWILSCSTYDGDEEATMGSEVTHIVAEVEHAVHAAVGLATRTLKCCFSPLTSPLSFLCVQELKEMLHQHPQAAAVHADWLDSCFSRQRRVDTVDFLHVLG